MRNSSGLTCHQFLAYLLCNLLSGPLPATLAIFWSIINTSARVSLLRCELDPVSLVSDSLLCIFLHSYSNPMHIPVIFWTPFPLWQHLLLKFFSLSSVLSFLLAPEHSRKPLVSFSLFLVIYTSYKFPLAILMTGRYYIYFFSYLTYLTNDTGSKLPNHLTIFFLKKKKKRQI